MNKKSEAVLDSQADYYALAKHWSDDIHCGLSVSRNRYQKAFCLTLLLATVLTIGLVIVASKSTLTPVLVNHYGNGLMTLSPFSGELIIEDAQIESELIHYVTLRESYHPVAFPEQYQLVTELSNDNIANDYNASQNEHNKASYLSRLGAQNQREVHVDSVVFLTNKQIKAMGSHDNLAEVCFTATEKSLNGTILKKESFNALMSWKHRGIPSNPKIRWRNWDGFEVIRYQVQKRNI